MAKSLTEFGWTYPLLADEDGLLIAGHLRHRAALKLRMTHVPVIVARGWSSAQKKAYCIADNQIATRANWDLEKLITLIESLAVDEFDQSRLGFDPEELSRLLALPPCLGDPEAVPTPPEHPVSTLGDWWSLGHHRVGCGDCTDASVVEPHLSSANPTLMVADQPYGVNYDPAFRSRADGNRGRATGVVLNDDQADWLPAWRLFPGNVAYVWHGGLQGDVVMQSLRQCGFEVRSQIIWVKSHFAVGRSDYHWQHEPCLYVVRRGAK
jgi:hypothetical protein